MGLRSQLFSLRAGAPCSPDHHCAIRRLHVSRTSAQVARRYPLQFSTRRFSMPNPADLFTSPAGLMALLYGRTGAAPIKSLFTASANSSSSTQVNEDTPLIKGRQARHKRQQQRREGTSERRRGNATPATAATNDAKGKDGDRGGGGGGGPESPSDSLFNSQAIVLALAIFVLTALWDFFNSQKSLLWVAFRNSVATTLEVRSSSQEFAMIVDWMGRQPHGQRIRNLSLKPVTVQDEQKTVWGPETTAGGAGSGGDADQRVMLVPGYGSHLFRFGSTWVYITRSEDPSKQKAAAANRVDRENDKLTLTFFTRRRAVVQQFMSHVRESWHTNVRNTVHIYLSEGYSARWRLLSERLRRPLSTLYLPAETKAIVEEARLFLSMKSTYAALGIPWRRGYLLEGPPGTGKSSFVMALAGELGLPVHILSLRSDNMDDDALLSLVSGLPPRSILLIEDFENALKARHTVSPPHSAGEEAVSGGGGGGGDAPTTYSTDVGGGRNSSLSLSALLNALDGVASSEGRLLLITANDTTKIPFAETLLRPGRIDRRVAFAPLAPEQVAEMRESFQGTLREQLPALSDAAVGVSPAAPGKEDDGATLCTPALYQQKLLDALYTTALQS